jgi:OpgC protein
MTCVAAIGEALALHAMPASFDILPLYFVLVAFFPLIYAGIGNLPWPSSLSPRRHGSLLASVIVCDSAWKADPVWLRQSHKSESIPA